MRSDFEEDVHPYAADNSFRCFKVRLDGLPAKIEGKQLIARIIAKTGTKLVGYQGYDSNRAQGATPDFGLWTWISPISMEASRQTEVVLSVHHDIDRNYPEPRADAAGGYFYVSRFERRHCSSNTSMKSPLTRMWKHLAPSGNQTPVCGATRVNIGGERPFRCCNSGETWGSLRCNISMKSQIGGLMRKLRCLFVALAGSLLLSVSAYGKPKPAIRTYDVSCADLWKAAKLTVKTYYDVLSLNNEEQLGSFTTGSTFSGVRVLSFSLSGTGNTCAVSVTGHFSGVTHHDKQDFFSRIKEMLKGNKTAAGSGPPAKN